MERPNLLIHTAISGFTQSVGKWNGILDLTEKLREQFCDGVRSRIHYYPWNANFAEVAEYYWALGDKYGVRPILGIYAYSWGAGRGAMTLARQLNRRGLVVRVMVLADPVYHHPFAPWRAFRTWCLPIVGEPVIRVPDNVREVYSFHQVQNRPGGHKLISAGRAGGAFIHPRVLLRYDHQYMDNAPEFHNLVLEEARKLCKFAGGRNPETHAQLKAMREGA
ncbi:hypothetical protein AB1L30_01245 [Bremerella sp. JC817]|uniref:hypothetical protein n=1 Tax=Bremerella sp. JC817 TaxID=3231756 RepID=UPI00345AD6F3